MVDSFEKVCEMNEPLVSILIPAYGAEATLGRCLDSVLAQTHEGLEIVVVDDGSADGTLAVARGYEADDGRVRVIAQANAGVAAARNAALDEAHGEFVLHVDADDWVEPCMVGRMLELMDGDIDIVFCGHDNASTEAEAAAAWAEGVPEVGRWGPDRQRLEFMRHKRMTGMLWNKLMRRGILEDLCFDERVGYGEDAQFLWQALKRSRGMAVTDEVLYHHTISIGSISGHAFGERKYSAIPMWEGIMAEAERDYPDLAGLARERLTSTAVYGLYEARLSHYGNEGHLAHMRAIVRENIGPLLRSPDATTKMKAYALAVCAASLLP